MKKGDKEYYYVYNLFRDVTGMLDSNGTQVVSYEYDTWGKLVNTTDTSGANIAQLNPIRYRCYCYDTDTAFYYIKNRYYDPETGRFLNPDTFAVVTDDLFSCENKNLYVYCNNKPVTLLDSDGEIGIVAWMLINGVINAGCTIMLQMATGQKIDWEQVLIAGASGAISAIPNKVISALATAVISSVAVDIYDCVTNKERNKTIEDIVINAAISAAITLAIPTTYFSMKSVKYEPKGGAKLFFSVYGNGKSTLLNYGTSSIKNFYEKKKIENTSRVSKTKKQNKRGNNLSIAERKMKDMSLFIG